MAPHPVASSEGLSIFSQDEGEMEASLFDRNHVGQAHHLEMVAGMEVDDDVHYSSIQARSLSKGGIAGVVVACVFAVFILICICLWPFIKRRFRRGIHSAQHAGPDAETGMAPMSEAAAPGAPAELSSKESLSHKGETAEKAAKRSSKEQHAAKGSSEGEGDSSQHGSAPQQQQERTVADADQTLDRNHSVLSRRHSGISTGQAPKWNTEGPPPGESVELVPIRADGLEYTEPMAGQSASYYSPTEAFGITTPPPTDEVSGATSGTRAARSGSRASSLKFNLMSLMRRMSSKDTAHASSPTLDSPTSPHTRALGPHHPAVGEEFVESPTTHTGPGFQQFGGPGGQGVPRLASPVPLPLSPASTSAASPPPDSQYRGGSEAFDMEPSESPPVLPPASPAPGTVNPMDIMAPSNQSEHVWHTNRELFYMANPQVLPASPKSTNLETPEEERELEEETQAQPSDQGPEPTGMNTFTAFEMKQEAQDQVQLDDLPPYQNGNVQDAAMVDAPAAVSGYDQSHLTPGSHYRNSSWDGSATDTTDYSTPMRGHLSPQSAHNTPNTALTEISPSPLSQSSPEHHDGTSPYSGSNGSPQQVLVCDQCNRCFSQIHKLNHHKRYHDRPHKCTHPECDKQFGTKTHLDRHINDKHNKIRKYHCLVQSCPYSKSGGKAFPRKDNWRRHMINKHSMSPSADPEPDLADEAMGGT